MNTLNFKFENGEAYVLKDDGKKKISKEVLTDICYLLLGHIAEPRDYSSVSSITKLLRIIDVECQPDESDAEEETAPTPAAPDPEQKTAPTPAAPEQKSAPKAVVKPTTVKKPIAAAAKKSAPPPAEDSSETSEDD